MSDNGTFKPVIVGFLCNWCSYRAADLAGTSRMGYPGDAARYSDHVYRAARPDVCAACAARRARMAC